MSSSISWQTANQHYLGAALTVLKVSLVERVRAADAGLDFKGLAQLPDLEMAKQQLQKAEQALPAASALHNICQLCRLSSFERSVLLLCAGMELDATFAPLFAAMQGDAQRNYPTFSLALGNLAEANWAALSPSAPLRYWQLLETGPGRALTLSPLRIDERVLNYLTGVHHLDAQLFGLVKPVAALGSGTNGQTQAVDETLVPSHQAIAQSLVLTWMQVRQMQRGIPILQVCEGDSGDRSAIAQAAATELGLNLYTISAAVLPPAAADINRLARRWHREAILSQSALLFEWDDDAGKEREQGGGERPSWRAIAQFLEEVNSPVIISSPHRQYLEKQTIVSFDVSLPTAQEQQQLWKTVMGITEHESNPALHTDIQKLVTQFNLNKKFIEAAYIGASSSNMASDAATNKTLWRACRNQARPKMESRAQRLTCYATWKDLVLPPMQLTILEEISAHLQQRAKVYQDWGFATQGERGLGITALFAGASGTGKTLAAEVLASTLDLDLYKIDLSSIISKYIGETEKNLGKVFDAAETGGAILLFDEADALFGKRNDVKDSHDRYANIEVSYLLQRMEAYRGLAILTTNLPDAIDRAFLRRIRFVVTFPFPELEDRVKIWQRMFPAKTPTEGLDYRKLAKLNIAGGNIRNITLNAAFLAAERGESVMMKHLLQATQREYSKLERPIIETEVKGWIPPPAAMA
ncbi:MAG: ATP-binding protein [Cyanobacteria bacterium J06634_6]